MIIPMSKVQIIGPKKHLAETIKEIHRLGCLHIIDIRKEPLGTEQFASPVRVDEATEFLRSKIEQAIARLTGLASLSLRDAIPRYEAMAETSRLYKTYVEKEPDQLLNIAEQVIYEVEQKPQKLAQEKEELEKKLALYQRYKNIITKVRPLIDKIIKFGNNITNP